MHSPSSYQTVLTQIPESADWPALAQRVLQQTFRTNFEAPGFSLVSFAMPISSEAFRACLIELKIALDALFFAQTGRHLVFRSLARFNQQNTTKFHLDGGPEESFLMLGYEPSDVPSSLAFADFTLVAWTMGIEPAAFIRDHNPMFASGAQLLEGAITPLKPFDPKIANIVVINNGSLPFDKNGRNLLGVMHQATIASPEESKRRIINSTMLRPAATLDEEEVTPEQLRDYVTTSHISGPVAY